MLISLFDWPDESDLSFAGRFPYLSRTEPRINEAQADGAVILVKWDVQRLSNRCTVSITKAKKDYAWRQDSDDIAQSLQAGLDDYQTRQGYWQMN